MAGMDSGDQKQLDFEIHFYERLLQDKPDQIDALTLLADAYTKRGLYQKGLEMDKRLAHLKPDDPIVFYNLACSLALVSKIDDAFLALEKSILLGYRDARHLQQDRDLQALRSDPRFQELLKKLSA